ncbi:MAG TPA: hypothetical protein VLI06_21540 [Solimonas sp.]|nr:hypothetical protein [Solimonas sp.]
MPLTLAPLCDPGPVLQAYTGKANTHPIYSNATPWRVAVTISFGEPGSFGADGGIDTTGDDLWTVLHVGGKQVAITFGHGASTATVIVEPGHAVTASADGGHVTYAVLGAVALLDEGPVRTKGDSLPKPQLAKAPAADKAAASRPKTRRRRA